MTHALRRGLVAAVVLAGVVPLAFVGLQSVADGWTGRSVLPQHLGGRGWRTVFGEPLLGQAITNSVVVAVAAVAVALVVGYGAAAGISSTKGASRAVLLGGILAPLLVPQLAVGAGLTTWLLRLGLADSVVGVGTAHLLYVLPYVVLALLPGFDDDLREAQEAAEALGASRRLRLTSVTLPALRANLVLAVALGFVVSWSQYGTSLAAGGGMPLLPLVVVPFVRADPQVGAALTVVLLIPAILLAAVAAGTNRSNRATLEIS
jgi:ABC-type spermidine/putrescine transport system permease subunit II